MATHDPAVARALSQEGGKGMSYSQENNRRWLIVGDSQSGKSTSGREITEMYLPRKKKVLILSIFGDWGRWVQQRGGRWTQLTRKSVGGNIWQPILDGADFSFVEFVGWSAKDIRAALDDLAMLVWEGKLDECLITVDEAHIFLPLQQCSEEFERLLLGIRHRGGDLIFITQEPQSISISIRNQCNVIVIHTLTASNPFSHIQGKAMGLTHSNVQYLPQGSRYILDHTSGTLEPPARVQNPANLRA